MTFSPNATPDPTWPGKAVEPAGSTPRQPGNFAEQMGNTPTPTAPPGAPQGPTPMSLASNTVPTSPPTVSTILNQTKSAQDTLGNISKQLKTPKLKLKRSQKHLLKNKLTNAHQYIRQASQKLGVESEPMETPSGPDPLGRFLAYVNDGQNQLVQAQQKLKEMSAHGAQINPAEMMAVTVKMNLAQQEIEYSSTLLSRVIEAFRQIMNMQL
jgi:flagellar hook-basal body complex protein FliE